MVKNVTLNCKTELVVSLGDISGLCSKLRRVRVSHVSNGPFTPEEITQFRKNFKSNTIPLTKEQIFQKERLIKSILSDNLSET